MNEEGGEFDISGARKGYDISMSIMDTFTAAATMGILADRSRVKQLHKKHLETANDMEAALSDIAGRTLNCRSPKQVKDFVYGDLGIKRQKKSTAQDHLMDIAAAQPEGGVKEILTAIIRVRQNRNIISRYINEDIIDSDGRIRCNWNLAGTRNGRLSTTKPWWPGVALQTVPYDARDIFIADPGTVFVGWDLGQAEARVVALLSNDFDLINDMESGVDIHIKLGSRLPFDMTYDEIVAKCDKIGKDKTPERVLSKTARHAMNYFLTWVGLQKAVNKQYLDTEVGINAAEAKAIRNAYISLSPGLEVWWDEVYYQMREKNYMINAFGRRRNFLGRLKKYDHLHRDGIAFFPQSSVADITTMAIAEITEKLEGWGQVMTHMHDGGFAQVPEDRKDEAVEIIAKATEREMIVNKEVLIIPTEVKVGYNWKDMDEVQI